MSKICTDSVKYLIKCGVLHLFRLSLGNREAMICAVGPLDDRLTHKVAFNRARFATNNSLLHNTSYIPVVAGIQSSLVNEA